MSILPGHRIHQWTARSGGTWIRSVCVRHVHPANGCNHVPVCPSWPVTGCFAGIVSPGSAGHWFDIAACVPGDEKVWQTSAEPVPDQ